MRIIRLFAALAAVALPVISYAVPVRHPAVKKQVHPAGSAAKTTALSAPVQPAGSRPFSDVPPHHWAAAAVETLRQRGIVVGYPGSSPHP